MMWWKNFSDKNWFQTFFENLKLRRCSVLKWVFFSIRLFGNFRMYNIFFGLINQLKLFYMSDVVLCPMFTYWYLYIWLWLYPLCWDGDDSCTVCVSWLCRVLVRVIRGLYGNDMRMKNVNNINISLWNDCVEWLWRDFSGVVKILPSIEFFIY